MNKLRYFVLFLVSFGLITCSKRKEDEVIGLYKIDKYVLRDPNYMKSDNETLLLNSDNSFELKKNIKNGDSLILSGIWSMKGADKVEFNFLDKEIMGQLRGTILEFDYPNDIHLGKYERLVYVKTRRDRLE